MPFRMQPARFPNGGFPECDDRTPNATESWNVGTPVTWDTVNSDLDAHALGATVTNILGVSLEGTTAGAPDNPSGKVGVALAGRSNVFTAKLTNGTATPVTPAVSDIGDELGIQKNGTGRDAWYSVDRSLTVNTHVEVIGIDTERDVVFFKFKESAIQQP
jgi:hypothetical protein